MALPEPGEWLYSPRTTLREPLRRFAQGGGSPGVTRKRWFFPPVSDGLCLSSGAGVGASSQQKAGPVSASCEKQTLEGDPEMVAVIKPIPNLQSVYISMYGRPADPQGLSFWNSATSSGTVLAPMIASFARSTEFKSLFGFSPSDPIPPSSNQLQIAINKVYQQAFGREADVDGLTYWTGQLQSGAVNATEFAIIIVQEAQAADAAVVAAKLTTANQFTASIDTTPELLAFPTDSGLAAGRSFLAPVVSVATQPTQAQIDAELIKIVDGAPNTGQTFTLTTAVDNLTGTTNNDTFNALIGDNATLTAADVINGLGGTDTLNITYAGGPRPSDALNGALISNIEFVNIRNTVDGVGNVITVSATGLQGVSASGAGHVTVTDLANNASFTANGSTGGVFSVGYAGAATNAALGFVGATTGAVTLTSGVLTTATISTSGAASTVASIASGISSLKTFAINAAADLTVTNGITSAGATGTLNVSGAAASVNVDTLDADFTTVNASGLSAGGLTAKMSATATTVITGGKGNDVITTGAVLTTGSVAAGDGTGDRLVVKDSTHVATAALAAKYTGFEQLEVGNGVSQDASLIAGITSIRIRDSDAATGVTGLSAAQAGAITVVAADAGSPITIGVAGAGTAGQIDTVALTIDDGASAVSTLALGVPVIANVEKLSINAIDNVNISALTSAASLDTITLTGAATQSITTGANSTNNFSINGSAATGALTLNATAYTTNGVSLTGGTAADTLTGSAQADNIIGGAGNDTLSGLGGTDTISGGDGTDTITGGAGADNLTGGAGVDTFVYTTLADSLAAAPDRITDLVAGTDKIDVTTLPAAILQGASFTAAGTGNLGTDIGSALTAGGGTFAANGAAVVTITGTGAGTYMVINDGTADYQSANDAVVNITGITGTLAVADFV